MKRSLIATLVVIAIVSTTAAAFLALRVRELGHREAQARKVAAESVQRAEQEAQQQRKVAAEAVQRADMP